MRRSRFESISSCGAQGDANIAGMEKLIRLWCDVRAIPRNATEWEWLERYGPKYGDWHQRRFSLTVCRRTLAAASRRFTQP